MAWTGHKPCTATGCSLTCIVHNASTYVDTLQLKGIGLQGAFCNSLSKLSRLTLLDLSGNHLTGTLPIAIGAGPTSTQARPWGSVLSSISIGNNNLTGSIPDSWAWLPLEKLSLSPNYKLCGTDWLGAINVPKGRGSKELEKAILAGNEGYSGSASTVNIYANVSLVKGTNLGVDCSLFAAAIVEASFGQLVWSLGTVILVVISSTWCLHN